MSNYWADDQAVFMKAGEQTVGVFNREQAERYAKHMLEEAAETTRDLEEGDYVKAIDGAVDSIVVAIGFLHSLGVDPFRAWDAVHAANMRKVVDGKLYRREDGQIGKPPGFVGPEAELAKLWNGVELGVDPFRAWDAVHAANMRKVVDGKLYRREDGQIGKPPGFVGPEAELAKLWNGVEA